MSRLWADVLLLLTAIIWGGAFVAQKGVLEHIGSYTFTAIRFAMAAALLLPLALREHRRSAHAIVQWPPVFSRAHWPGLCALCVAFTLGVVIQQVGLETTTVTNAGFITSIYVVLVPVIGLLFYRQRPSVYALPAAVLTVPGVWLLSGGGALDFVWGDFLMLLAAFGFAWHVVMIGRLMPVLRAPFRLSVLQYIAVALIAAIPALLFEDTTLEGLKAAIWPILYAGVISAGIAYTLQVIAQAHTPSADAAVILSSEAIFAAIAGMIFMGDMLTPTGFMGAALIIVAILLVELGPAFFRRARLT